MILPSDLLRFNQEGYIPGPYENEQNFLKRIELSKKLIEDPKKFFIERDQTPPFDIQMKILKPRWNWTRAQLMNLFDVSPLELAMFYSDEKLNFFQGAATWILPIDNIKIPILQFRRKLKKNSYMFIYTLDEILAHEAVHSMRVEFDEPKTEEIFSYMTSTSYFRKIFGPIIRDPNEVMIFLGVFLGYFIFHFFHLIFNLNLFFYISFFLGLISTGLIFYGFARLFFIRRKFFKTLKNLTKIFNDKKTARSVLFRLTDFEIFKFYKLKKTEIINYFEKSKDLTLRLKMIYLAYFDKLEKIKF